MIIHEVFHASNKSSGELECLRKENRELKRSEQEAQEENEKLKANEKALKKEIERLTKSQKSEMQNVLKTEIKKKKRTCLIL